MYFRIFLLFIIRYLLFSVLQKRTEFLCSSGTVADLIFYFLAQVGTGFFVAIRTEDGVVAKAPYSTTLAGNLSLDDALEEVFLLDAGTAAGTDVLLLY